MAVAAVAGMVSTSCCCYTVHTRAVAALREIVAHPCSERLVQCVSLLNRNDKDRYND